MIFNLDSLHYVARRPVWALAWRDRLRGMIGRRFEPEGIDAMIFPRCNAIHTMWMSIPIDVVFLDADAEVAGLCAGLKPWRLPVSCRRAVTVIELPAGRIAESGTEVGHHLNLNSTLSPEMIEKLLPMLTEEEAEVYRRGRNAKSPTMAKNATMSDYRKATGFEALMGYLYLKDEFERLVELVKTGVDELALKM